MGRVASLQYLGKTPAAEVEELVVSYGIIFRGGTPAATKVMFVFAFVSINVIALAVVTIALHRAPEGYEDELGFHFIKASLPGCGGSSRLLD